MSAGLDWRDYVDWLVTEAGTLAAVADRLAAARGYRDDAGSIERALRRLRGRGNLHGGTWGHRALATFGLPGDVVERVRWLGQYHARGSDIPVRVCADLLRAWDRPPISTSALGRAWLTLGRASLALRDDRGDDAIAELERGRADLRVAPAAVRTEATLMRAYVASRVEPAEVAALLALAERLLPDVTDAVDRACLRARVVDHHTYELNGAGQHAAAVACWEALPADGPWFALARRESGLAFARWRLGDPACAVHAARAVRLAGDGGHLRARAMALALFTRITGDPSGHARAVAIAAQLEDATLLRRLSAARL